jgi:hypothetical protein
MNPPLFIFIVALAVYLGFIIGRATRAADQWDAGFHCAKEIYKRRLNEAEQSAARARYSEPHGICAKCGAEVYFGHPHMCGNKSLP